MRSAGCVLAISEPELSYKCQEGKEVGLDVTVCVESE